MSRDVWLPVGHHITDDVSIRRLLFSGGDWQIFDTTGAGRVLVARALLADKWCACGLLDASWLVPVDFGELACRALLLRRDFVLGPLDALKSPGSRSEVRTFAAALRASRELVKDASFHDAIYVEEFARLLPTWTDTECVDDKTVLGTWLTGGVAISTDAFQRLKRLTSWLSGKDLVDVLEVAGLEVPEDGGMLTRQQSERTEAESLLKEDVSAAGPKLVQDRSDTFRLPGRPRLEAFFNEHVVDIVRHRERYAALGIEFPSAMVLYGPPGCGKTYAVERLTEFLGWPCWSIDSGSVGSPYIHDTSKKISAVFDKAIETAPSVLVIDEMESFLSSRQGIGSLHHVEEVAEFLRRLPEASRNQVLVVAMTNMIDMIDPAILRRGRFDHIIEVGMPSREEVASLTASLLEKLPRTPDLCPDRLIDLCTGRPISDAVFLIREAARQTVKEGRTVLDQASLDAVLGLLSGDRREPARRRIGLI